MGLLTDLLGDGNATSTVAVQAAAMVSASGSPTLGLAGAVRAWSLDAAAAEAVGTNVTLPDGWATYDVEIVWANNGAGSGDVVWRFDKLGFGAETDDWSTISNGPIVTDTAGAQSIEVHTTLASGQTVPAGGSVAFRVFRVATAGGDTLANDASLATVRFTKAS